MMKAVRFHGQKDIRLDDVDTVQCGRDQVKVGSTLPNQNSSFAKSVLSILCQIKPAFVGICGTGMLARPLMSLQSDEVDEVCFRLE